MFVNVCDSLLAVIRIYVLASTVLALKFCHETKVIHFT